MSHHHNRIRPISKSEQQHPWEASHAAIAIIQNLHGDVLLTQRAPHKAAGLKWGCTGGGVATGETTLLALQRETAEEIGLDITDASPILLNKFLLDGDFGKWCLHVYLIRTDLTLDMLTFQPDEVIDVEVDRFGNASRAAESDIAKLGLQQQILIDGSRTAAEVNCDITVDINVNINVNINITFKACKYVKDSLHKVVIHCLLLSENLQKCKITEKLLVQNTLFMVRFSYKGCNLAEYW